MGSLSINIGKGRKIILVQVYAPTAEYPEEEKVKFYEDLEIFMYRLKRYKAAVFIMGDFEAWKEKWTQIANPAPQ